MSDDGRLLTGVYVKFSVTRADLAKSKAPELVKEGSYWVYRKEIPVEEYDTLFTYKLSNGSDWTVMFNCLQWIEAADNNPSVAGSEYGAFVAHNSKLAYEEYLSSIEQ